MWWVSSLWFWALQCTSSNNNNPHRPPCWTPSSNISTCNHQNTQLLLHSSSTHCHLQPMHSHRQPHPLLQAVPPTGTAHHQAHPPSEKRTNSLQVSQAVPSFLIAAPPTPISRPLHSCTQAPPNLNILQRSASVSRWLNDDWPQSVVQWVAQALQKTAEVNRDGRKTKLRYYLSWVLSALKKWKKQLALILEHAAQEVATWTDLRGEEQRLELVYMHVHAGMFHVVIVTPSQWHQHV